MSLSHWWIFFYIILVAFLWIISALTNVKLMHHFLFVCLFSFKLWCDLQTQKYWQWSWPKQIFSPDRLHVSLGSSRTCFGISLWLVVWHANCKKGVHMHICQRIKKLLGYIKASCFFSFFFTRSSLFNAILFCFGISCEVRY